MVESAPQQMIDFDRVTIEREQDEKLWINFCKWKDTSAAHAYCNLTAPGDIFSAKTHSFINLHVPLRSPVPPHAVSTEDRAFLAW